MKSTISTTQVARTEEVNVQRIDDLFVDFVAGMDEPKVFLKIDTQGFDQEVLAGARESMARISGVQTELAVIPLYEGSPDYLDSLANFRRLGFEPTGFFPILNSPVNQHLVEFDAVLTRRFNGSATSK